MRGLFHVSRAQPVNALEAGGGFLDVAPRPAENLPGWNLADLYPDGGEQLNADLERAARGAAEFREKYATKLDALARENPAELARAIAAYEAQSDLMGRIGSYAYLNYVTNTSDPARAKLFGDAQDKLTSVSTQLLFFELELNRIDDAAMDAALKEPALAYYKPWFTDLRKERPYQLSDEIERLFHEKAMTGPAAWSRLFNETLTSLRFEIDGETYSIETALNFLSDVNPNKRAAAAASLG